MRSVSVLSPVCYDVTLKTGCGMTNVKKVAQSCSLAVSLFASGNFSFLLPLLPITFSLLTTPPCFCQLHWKAWGLLDLQSLHQDEGSGLLILLRRVSLFPSPVLAPLRSETREMSTHLMTTCPHQQTHIGFTSRSECLKRLV